MVTGEGGMLVTDRKDLFDRVQILRDHGRVPGDVSFFNREGAFKYKMSSMQAALGLAQVERAEELVAMKRQIFRWYADRLSHIPGVSLNPESPTTRNSYWMSTVVFDESLGLTKQHVIQQLAVRQIDSRPFFFPLSQLPAYADIPNTARARVRNVVASRISPHGVNLPCGLSVTEAQVDCVCSAIREILSESQHVPLRRAG